jgi:hypothetical protein
MTNFIRVLIVVGLVVLVYLLVQKTTTNDDKPLMPKQIEAPTVNLSDAELEALLKETIKTIWDAIEAKDWLKVYEMHSPRFRADTPLVTFMQGKDSFYFENWSIEECVIDGLIGNVKIKHDWGVHLDMEIDLGDTHKEGAVKEERYEFDPSTEKWYPTYNKVQGMR